jgi:hypothetical protein
MMAEPYLKPQVFSARRICGLDGSQEDGLDPWWAELRLMGGVLMGKVLFGVEWGEDGGGQIVEVGMQEFEVGMLAGRDWTGRSFYLGAGIASG